MPNGSFEERVDCIWNDSNVEDAPPWFNPTDATPDVFHACAVINEAPCPWPETSDLDPWGFGTPTNVVGCEAPYAGVGYAGMFVYGPDYYGFNGYREYLAVRLTEPLQAGTDYTVKFYVSLSDRSGYAIWNIQAYFGQDSLTPMDTVSMAYNSYIDVEPQLSGTPGEFITNYDGWYEMAWDYTAAGGEQYMYIGNFERNVDIDTLYVLPFNPFGNDDSYSYYFIDDVQVREGILSVGDMDSHFSLKTYPNPAIEKVFIESAMPISRITLFDAQGRIMFEKTGLQQAKFDINISNLPGGIYFLRMNMADERRVVRKIMKTLN